MALRDRLVQAAQTLLGQTTYQADAPPIGALDLDDEAVRAVRRMQGGQLQPVTQSQVYWFQSDLVSAQRAADNGDLALIGKLWREMQSDGLIRGLLSTRTAGLIALPKVFRGSPKLVEALKADTATRSLFDEIAPPAELARIAADGIGPGYGVGELCPVVGRKHKRLVRLDPEFVIYRHQENRWYYRSSAGLVAITPGDGRWVLHLPGGVNRPWEHGNWRALGRAFISRTHARLHRGNYSGKLANPARVAYAPHGATEHQRQGFLASLIAWGINSVFELPPGWDAKLLESNGRGWEVFKEEIDDDALEIMITLAGQVVTVTGGSGFANADIHQTIRADLIKETADSLSYTINTQILAPWAVEEYGIEILSEPARVEWAIAKPVDRKADGEALKTFGEALEILQRVAAANNLKIDALELFGRFGVPLEINSSGAPAAPSEDEKAAMGGESDATLQEDAPDAGDTTNDTDG